MRLDRRDLWILIVAITLSVATVSLHIREVVRTGVAQPPVYAAPGTGSEAYPTVGGTVVEVDSSGTALRPGDRLLSVGLHDLRGRGYLGFLGLALQEAGSDLRVPVVYERAGRQLETEMRLRPFAVSWLRVPFLVSMLPLMILTLLRRPGDAFTRLGVVAFTGLTVGEAIFEGGSLAQTVVAKLVFMFSGGIWWPLMILWLSRLPGNPSPEPMVPGAGWLAVFVGLCWVVPKSFYLLPGPVPPSLVPSLVTGAEAVGVLISVGIMVWNYQHLDAGGRRRIRWAVAGSVIAAVPFTLALGIPAFDPGFRYGSQMLAVAGLSAVLIPVSFLIAIVGYDLFDVDRLIGVTASYSLMLGGLVAALVAMVPPAAAWVSSWIGVDLEASRLALSVALAVTAVPVSHWLRPRIDRWVFPERRRIAKGMEALLADQARESRPAPLAERLAMRLHALLRPRLTAVYARRTGGMQPVARLTESEPPRLPSLPEGHALLEQLAGATKPLVLEPTDAEALGVDARGLTEAGAAVILPIAQGRSLPALVVLGPKRSGDLYTATELALLTALVEAAARQLGRAEAAEARARERLRAEEMDRRRQAAEDVGQSRSRHLAAASHDLRQPLHALGLFAGAVLERAHGEDNRELARRIHDSAAALREMFDSLIDLSRLDQGMLASEPEDFEVAPLVERLVAEAEPLAQEKGLELRSSTTTDRAHSDPVLLGRILRNLLSNAIRYTSRGHVGLHVEARGDGLRIVVEDSGPGIAAENREAIFQEFVRLDPEQGRGLGLGLSIVQRLAEFLGHPLDVESRLGEGTRFSLEVPRAAATAGASAAGPDAPAAQLAGRRVLLVDEDLDVLAGTRVLLETWGVDVRLATDRSEALAALEGAPLPDLILADYRLGPNETGTAVIEALRRAAGREIPAIVVTGSASPEVVEELSARGIPRLKKPVQPARLRATLHSLVGAAGAGGGD